jgi:hypothetical protein
MNFKRGCLVKVRAYGGKEIFRRFVAELNGTILICSEEEYRLARLQKRDPLCVGFPVADVIDSQSSNRAHAQSGENRSSVLKSSSKKPPRSSLVKKPRSKGQSQRRESSRAT